MTLQYAGMCKIVHLSTDSFLLLYCHKMGMINDFFETKHIYRQNQKFENFLAASKARGLPYSLVPPKMAPLLVLLFLNIAMSWKVHCLPQKQNVNEF